MRLRLSAALAAAWIVVTLALVRAATPTFWQVATQADFLNGQVENLSIDGDGRVVLGPAAELAHETSAPFIWTLVEGTDGTLWAGSGNEGKVFQIDRNGKATTFFDAAELEVHALALVPGGGLYVATSPDGKIYRVDAEGKAGLFFDPEEKYIWALLVAADGTVFAGTGEKGVLYRISPDGKGEPLYRTKATHVVSLTSDRDGNIIVGTGSPGQVLRVDAAGKAFVLLDSKYEEVRALRLAPQGVLYAAAVSARVPMESRPTERPEPEAPRPAPAPSVSTEITAIALGEVSLPASTQLPSTRRDERRSPRGALYRIAPDGLWDVVWESEEDLPYDVTFDTDGALVIGTGSEGKIFHVSGEPSKVTLLTRAGAQQVTCFLRDRAGRTYYATANPGKIFRLSRERAERGTYESDIRDAATVATWGTISWRAQVPPESLVQLFSRSGNTSTPDETWSPWTGPYANADGEQVQSPKARYLQWKAVLAGKRDSPVLTSVTVAYLQRNLRPQVTSITVHPPGTVFQKPFSTGEMEIAGYEETTSDGRQPTVSAPAAAAATLAAPAPALGRRAYQKGLQTFVWKAEDGNSDSLQYDVVYRREGETIWKPLRRSLWDPIFVWDTTSVPDGTYLIKIIASDTPSNSPGTALSGELESTTFDIDNTPPRIEVQPSRQAGRQTTLSFWVRDDQSPVRRVEFSTDANRWRVIYPKDGIPDSRAEEFEIALEGNGPGGNVIVRATDAMNNTTTAVGALGAEGRKN